jgi:hypothetical protein
LLFFANSNVMMVLSLSSERERGPDEALGRELNAHLYGIGREPRLSGKLKRYKVAVENTLRHEYLDSNHLLTT